MVKLDRIKKQVERKNADIQAYAEKIAELQRKKQEAEQAQAVVLGNAVLKVLGGELSRLDALLEYIGEFDVADADEHVEDKPSTTSTDFLNGGV